MKQNEWKIKENFLSSFGIHFTWFFCFVFVSFDFTIRFLKKFFCFVWYIFRSSRKKFEHSFFTHSKPCSAPVCVCVCVWHTRFRSISLNSLIDRSIDRSINWLILVVQCFAVENHSDDDNVNEKKKEKVRKCGWLLVVGCEKWFSGKLPGKIIWIFRVHFHSRLSIFFSFNEVKILLFLRHRHRFVYRIEKNLVQISLSLVMMVAINKPKLKLKKTFFFGYFCPFMSADKPIITEKSFQNRKLPLCKDFYFSFFSTKYLCQRKMVLNTVTPCNSVNSVNHHH